MINTEQIIVTTIDFNLSQQIEDSQPETEDPTLKMIKKNSKCIFFILAYKQYFNE